MKKILKKMIVILVVLVITLNHITWAATNLNNEKSKINNQMNKAKESLEDVQNEKSDTLKEVDSLKEQIMTYENEINDLDKQMQEINNEITKAEEQIKVEQEKYEEQSALLDERLVTLYEAGSITYLDLLLSSGSLSEFISNYYLISELTLNDNKLLDEIEESRKTIEESKKQIEENKATLEATKKNKEVKSNELKELKAQKDTKVSELSEEEQQIQKTINELEEANKSIDEKILAAAKEAENNANNSNNNNSNNGSGNNSDNDSGSESSSGFINPVDGYPITTGLYYSDGSYHGAVDFSGSGITGKPIKAVADGTVIISERVNGSYGNYIIIRHYNGLYTLYAHGQDGSRTVSAGDKVSQGQTIMRVGNTGNSTGPHLHFEVRKSPGTYSNRVDPRPYLP